MRICSNNSKKANAMKDYSADELVVYDDSGNALVAIKQIGKKHYWLSTCTDPNFHRIMLAMGFKGELPEVVHMTDPSNANGILIPETNIIHNA